MGTCFAFGCLFIHHYRPNQTHRQTHPLLCVFSPQNTNSQWQCLYLERQKVMICLNINALHHSESREKYTYFEGKASIMHRNSGVKKYEIECRYPLFHIISTCWTTCFSGWTPKHFNCRDITSPCVEPCCTHPAC